MRPGALAAGATRGAISVLLLSLANGCEAGSEATVFEPIPSAVASSRAALLDKGFVATDWVESKYVRNQYTASDLGVLKAAGIRSIRVPFGIASYADSSALLFQPDTPDTPNPVALANYDEVIDVVLAQGLGFVVTPGDSDSKTWSDAAYQAKLVRFWRAFGQHLASRDPERVFIKVGYDPTSGDTEAWYSVQRELLAAVRESNPNRTLLVTPNAYTRLSERDPLKALLEMTPEADPNVVYDFGFSTPVAFTLQGATWWHDEPLALLDHLPYPSSPQACAPTLASITDADTLRVAKSYCAYSYDEGVLAALFGSVAQWARANRVPVSSSGLGVYKAHVDDQSRYNWFSDARRGLEAEAIPWALYNDLPDFSGLTGDSGSRAFEPGVQNALFGH